MAQGRTKFELGENIFHIKRFPPRLSLEILGDLQKKAVGPLASLVDVQDADDEGRAVASFQAGLEKLSATLDGKSLMAIVDMVVREDYVSIQVQGGEAQILTHSIMDAAMEDVTEIVGLAIEVLKVNYSKVFIDVKARIGLALKKKQEKPAALSILT